MIRKIKSINNFAVFNDFDWDKIVRDKGNNVIEFKKLNIFYGRNYSGKTTLSRILRCLEEKKLHDKYLNAEFEVETIDQNINQNDLINHTLNIRVYNSDFVQDNLSFLKNENGEITPFAIIGEENIKIEEQIAEKEAVIGNVEQNTGVRFKIQQKYFELSKKKEERESEEANLETLLKNKANQDIKRNTIYNVITYNINSIKQDIQSILNHPKQLLTDKEIEDIKALLREETKTDITKIRQINTNFDESYKKASELLIKEIKPTETINDLINDAILQEWVRTGIKHHKGKRSTCAFCGNIISENLWNKLDSHFNKESENLRDLLQQEIQSLEKMKLKIADVLNIETNAFYASHQDNYSEYKRCLTEESNVFNKTLDSLKTELEKREKDIFTPREKIELNNNTNKINEIIVKINELIDTNNKKADSLIEEQEEARAKLRINEVAKFINDIGYQEKVRKIDDLQNNESIILNEYNELDVQLKTLEQEIDNLKIQLKDEKIGADKINKYLNHFFGADSFKFEAVESEGDTKIKFLIKRGEEIAHKLSEGECSLIAFCYFIAKLEDTETKDKDLIIWIDDPVCSLDNNHVFFIFSLIESIITKPYKKSDNSNGYNYNQLFISTHNIDFLKYLKKLSKPKKQNKDNVEYFILERQGQKSELLLMPDYLKKYTTEFNYLFHQIYKCSLQDEFTDDYGVYYNFGNNLRKFLEAYLFYKYPSNTDILVKLKKFFKDDTSVAITNRIDNELSHLEEIFDRSMRPIDIPEIPKLANYVLSKIKEKDSEQYNALLKSIED
jgi:wobble nucleotide-excising tRNase